MSDPVLYEQDGHVVTLTLNRPEMRNPISEAGMVDGIVEALGRINRDPEVRCAILTGAGSAFSSGGDLRKMHDALEQRAADPTLTTKYYSEGIQRIPLAFEKLEVPIIAAVNGPAIGAGMILTCMCDIRIAAESARGSPRAS
jgi:enoyl-CoA hydratase/carnithine racemase